jgi:beta-phosphoglucomutase-like phosphatase (HAD superfamily)
MERPNRVTQDIEAKISPDTVLFFDLDGTLVDTNFANFLSYKKAIQSVTKSEIDLVYVPNQRFNRSVLINKISNLTENEYDRIIKEKEHYYKDFLTETKINKTVTDILFKYSKANKNVLVTNCREERAVMILNYHGLMDKFSSVFFRQFNNGNEKINKFQYAIQTLAISPKLIVVFENEKSEIEDAIQAGIISYNLIKL